MRSTRLSSGILVLAAMAACASAQEEPKPVAHGEPLPKTRPLTIEGDIAAELVAAVDRFFLRELEAAPRLREKFWAWDTASLEAWEKSIEPNRRRG